MTYRVQQVAKLSGVSVRTLHFYDEIGLLKPAFIKENGYRYYEEKELLVLQQILFFRELGFELKKIQKILGKKDFDQVGALLAHKKVLQADGVRIKKLIKTIDKTTTHLSGEKKIKDADMYHGFTTKKKQVEYEIYLQNRLGPEDVTLEESRKNVKEWTKVQWEASHQEFNQICRELSKMMEALQRVDSPKVQLIIHRHYEWIKKFWIPNRNSYIGLGQSYLEVEWKKAFEPYDPHHPCLAKYLADAMRVFAQKELT